MFKSLKSFHLYDWFIISILILVATNSYTGYLLYNSKSDTKDLHHDCELKRADLEKELAVYYYIDSLQEVNINNLKEQLKIADRQKEKIVVKYRTKYEKAATVPYSDIVGYIDSLLSECRQHPLPGDFEILN